MEIRKTLGQIGICAIITGVIGFIMAYIYIFEPVLRISQVTNNWILIYVVDLKIGVTDIDWNETIGGVELYIILFIIDFICTRPVNDVLFLGLFKLKIAELIIMLVTITGIGITLSLIPLLSKSPTLDVKKNPSKSPTVDKSKNYKMLLGTIGSLTFAIPMIFLVAVENFAPEILPSYIQYVALYAIMGIGLVILSTGFKQRNNSHKIYSIITVVMSFTIALLLGGHYLEKNYLYNKYYWSPEGFMMGPLGSFIYNARLILPYIALVLATLLIASITVIYGYKLFLIKNPINKVVRGSGVLMAEWGWVVFFLAIIYVGAKIDDLTIGIRSAQLYFFDSFQASVINYYMMFIKGLRTETLYDYLFIGGFLPLAILMIIYGISYILEIKHSPITTKNVREK